MAETNQSQPMNLTELNLQGFVFDPSKKDLVEKLEAVSDYFKADIKINKRKYFIYLSLLYDPKSEIRRTIVSLPQLKVTCALIAGFELHQPENKFTEDVENAMIGVDLVAARMASEFCIIVQGMNMTLYTFYSRIFVELIALSHKTDKLKDMVTLISKVKAEAEKMEDKILGTDETVAFRKSLYLSSKSVSLGLQIEDIISRIEKGDDLADLNPFPSNYKPNKLAYAGDELPKEQ